jgi:AhpD family alkylhydroperoxidase
VQLTASSVNGCPYCQAVHEWIGRKAGIPAADLEAIRERIVRTPIDEQFAK